MLPGLFLYLRSENSRLALRQLATAATSMRDGFGPVSLPSGADSSVCSAGIAVSSNSMRKT